MTPVSYTHLTPLFPANQYSFPKTTSDETAISLSRVVDESSVVGLDDLPKDDPIGCLLYTSLSHASQANLHTDPHTQLRLPSARRDAAPSATTGAHSGRDHPRRLSLIHIYVYKRQTLYWDARSVRVTLCRDARSCVRCVKARRLHVGTLDRYE